MNWTQIGRLLRTIFLLRVPLIMLLLLAGLGFLARGPADTLLGNLFDLRVIDTRQLDPTGSPAINEGLSGWYLFAVALAAFMLSWTAVSVINLVVLYGRDRFADSALSLDQKRPGQTFLLGFSCAAIFVFFVVWQTPLTSNARRLGMPVLGFLCSMGFVVVSKVIQLASTDPRVTPHPPPYLVFPAYIFPPLERRFDALYCWIPPGCRKVKGRLNRSGQWLLEIFRCAGQGFFVDLDAPVGKLIVRSGHVFAGALAVIALAIYLIIGAYKGTHIDDKPAIVPALAYVLLFLIVACWFLGGLTFFLDRYRVPLLTCLAILSLATTYSPESDHIYRVEVRSRPKPRSPWDVIAARNAQGHKRVIAIATAGGGIQAAAWTARVLRGLEEECAKQEVPCNFRDSVVVISSVSGGSLGTIAYARSFTDGRVSANDVVGNAELSAIDEVAWGWTNPDVFRSILPWFRRQYVDRGWALEQRWNAVNKLDDKVEKRDLFLGDWVEPAGKSMPALMLNATIMETGRPLVFSTSAFPGKDDRRGLINFYDLIKDQQQLHDIRVDTATRLSASFFYVSPAARSNAQHPTVPDYHAADGGYYDNYGVVALLGWLESAIAGAPGNQDADILVLEIRPFSAKSEPTPRVHGWGFQLVAPAEGMLDVRETAQSLHDDSELALFAHDHWQNGVRIWRANFFYPAKFRTNPVCTKAPLSWKLSEGQLYCIGEGWSEFGRDSQSKAAIDCVVNFLNGAKSSPKPGEPNLASFCKRGDAN